MKKLKLLTLSTLLIVCTTFNIRAQEQSTQKFMYEKGKNNWIIEAGGIASIYMGQQDNQLYFWHRVGWGGSFVVGKWFTPCVGFKGELTASKYYGAAFGDTNANFIQKDIYWNRSHSRYNIDNLLIQEWFAFNPNIDIMFSLFNSLGKAKEKRIFDMILSIGGGIYVNNGGNIYEEYNQDEDRIIVSPTLNIGLQNKFKLSKQVDLNIDLRAGWVSNSFDGQTISSDKHRKGDLIASVGLSLTYKFKPRGYDKYTPIVDYSKELDDYKNMYAQLQLENDSLRNTNKLLNNKLNNTNNISQPTTQIQVVEKEIESKIIAIIEYKIGVSELNRENRAKLKAAAEIIKANPNYMFEVCGYADNETGSKDINIRLRNARANRAIDQLLHYGVNRNQILKATNDGELPGTTTRAIVIKQLNCN